jgi:ubiquinone/menaquinone biosynthesis C-methylase UbiE
LCAKPQVREHWERETAGVRYGEGQDTREFYQAIEDWRYSLEPYIPEFAQFQIYQGKKILEIGVGAGTDFSQFLSHGARATGVDLTAASIQHTARRLEALGHSKDSFHLSQADTENLPFSDNSFDLVYSWGVLHHTPDTPRAFAEARRVLKPGCYLRAMVYHVPSWTGWLLWVRHSLLRGKPFLSPRMCIYRYLESPGTHSYTAGEADTMVQNQGFAEIDIKTELGPSDLPTIRASHRYQGRAYRLIWFLYPRWLVRRLGRRFGLYLLITAKKPPMSPNSAAGRLP